MGLRSGSWGHSPHLWEDLKLETWDSGPAGGKQKSGCLGWGKESGAQA